MTKKNITIDDLARMVQKGFDGTDLRFDKVNLRFDKVDGRLNKIDDRLETIEKLFIADHRQRIEKLETEVRELKDLLAVK
ncbi:MAG: hypothetical protein HYT20_00865 [Candidatus Nealsonbacteria bacterium]|nr:hypothetical protein [Candidatus Nealsonbacteria bacterium]